MTGSRTFRVFVSSTFEDLREERNALQQKVFPKLADFCAQHGARFQAIDLRWGVRDAAGRDQKTMDICLAEIARCQRSGIKPNFIVLLGERYGWRPVPAHIAKTELETVIEHIAGRADRDFVQGWYRLDENAGPPEYLLQPRSGDLLEWSAWEPVERRLRESLLQGARAAGLSPDALARYEASATHQEILAGLGPTARDREQVFAFFRQSTRPRDPELVRLKQYLEQELPGRVLPFSADPGLEELCHAVEKSLQEVIAAVAERFPAHSEKEAHDQFARDRTSSFFGRKDVLDSIREYLAAGAPVPLVLHGLSGSGKSAIMAKASEGLNAVRRFIGATAESSSGITLLNSLANEIGHLYGKGGDAPASFNELSAFFVERLRLATAEDPLILFVDALDQLSPQDPAAAMSWIPSELPPHCRIVVSAIDTPAPLLQASLLEVPPFPVADADLALGSWFGDVHRTLQVEQRMTLLASFSRSGLPLYLKLAFEEARLWRSFDPLDCCLLGEGLTGIMNRLCDRLEDAANHGPVLVNRAFGYLTAARYGLAEDEMLAVLTRDDAVWSDVVGDGARRHHDPPARQIPVIVWSRLYLDLEPYLTDRSAPGGTVIAFFHRRLAEHISARYLDGAQRELRHRALADFFAGQPSEHRPFGGRSFGYRMVLSFNHRKLNELPYQLCLASAWDRLEALLTDIPFLDVKARAGRIRDLVEDYILASTRWSEPFPEAGLPWLDFQRFIASEAHVFEKHIHAYPQLFFQQAYNLARTGRLHDACERELALGRGPEGYWFERVNRPSQPQFSSCIFTLADHPGQVYSIAFSQDGTMTATASTGPEIYISSGVTGAAIRTLKGHSSAVAEVAWTDSGLLLSSSWDATVRVWNPQTGECRHVLAGHSGPVTCIHLLDPDRCLTAGFDGSLRVWNFRTGVAEAVLTGHAGPVIAAFVLPSGRIVSAAEDGAIRVWPLSGGEQPRELHPGSSALTAAAPLPSGRVAVGCQDGRIEIWDVEREARELVMEGHLGAIAGIARANTGHYWSWSYDYTIRRWSPQGENDLILRDHDSAVTSAVLLGGHLVSASQDTTLRVWDLVTGDCQAVLRGHRSWITALAAGPGGRIASGSWDRAARIWDIAAAVSAPPEELAPILPDIAQARALSMAVVRDETTAFSMTKDPQHVQVWNLESGECVRVAEEEQSPEYLEFRKIFKRSNDLAGWTYSGRDDIDDWGMSIHMAATKVGEESPGIGCAWARRHDRPDLKGVSEYQENLALYPLRARPMARVFEAERTIAFDALSREAHVLRLREPLLEGPNRQ